MQSRWKFPVSLIALLGLVTSLWTSAPPVHAQGTVPVLRPAGQQLDGPSTAPTGPSQTLIFNADGSSPGYADLGGLGLDATTTRQPYVLGAVGQSNMAASGDPSEGDHSIAAGIKICNANNTTAMATAMVTPAYGSGALGQSVNACIAFANELRASGRIPASREIWIIPCWQGGQPIEQWVGSGTSSPYWQGFLNGLSVAEAAYGGPLTIQHMMFMQGEANANNQISVAHSQAAYLAQLSVYLSQCESLPQWTKFTTFTISELGLWPLHTENDRNDAIRAAGSLGKRYLGIVSADGLTETILVVSSHAHFSGQSLYTLGQRHFAESLRLRLGSSRTFEPRTSDGFAYGPLYYTTISSGTYSIDWDVARNGIFIQVTGNCSIAFPDSTKFGNAAIPIIINNQTAATITITAPNTLYTGGGSTVGPNTPTALQTSYNEWRWYPNRSTGWTLSTQSVMGTYRKMRTPSGSTETIGNRELSGTMFPILEGGTKTLAAPGFSPGANAVFDYRGKRDPAGASITTNATMSLSRQASKIVAPGSGYVPGDTITWSGGTFTTAATTTVVSTRVASASVAAGGTGGTTGTQLVTGTTGTGTKFSAYVTISGGAISGVQSITVAGSYTVNPTNLSSEPVTGAGLTGATLSLTMGVDSIDDGNTAGAGSYSSPAVDTMTQSSTSGAGTGAKLRGNFTSAFVKHPKASFQTLPITGIGQTFPLDAGSLNWKVGFDPLHVNPTLPRDTSTLTTGTLTHNQACMGHLYSVAAGAALTLPYAGSVDVGRTAFLADYSQGFTITTQGNDRLSWNGRSYAAGATVTVPANQPLIVESLGDGVWFAYGAAAPAYGTWYPLGTSAVQQSHTGDLLEYTFATVNVPANAIGPNGALRVTTLWSFSSSTNSKRCRVRYNGASGTAFLDASIVTSGQISGRDQREIHNRGVTNSQVCSSTGMSGFGSSGAAIVTSSVDTTAATSIVISGQLGLATESVALEFYLVEAMYKD